ncbi:hypothetical protein BC828DRAFT_397641 [Blastocladiella britannica]|nr:hypothetical protein BC828DRAFT_397641 [Blastocladiella britannica]
MSDSFKVFRTPVTWIVNNAARARGAELQALAPEGIDAAGVMGALAYKIADLLRDKARQRPRHGHEPHGRQLQLRKPHRGPARLPRECGGPGSDVTRAADRRARPPGRSGGRTAPRRLITEPFSGGDQEVFPFCARFRRVVATSPDALVALLWEHLRNPLKGDALALLAGTYLPQTMEEPLALLERTYGLDSAPLLASFKHSEMGAISPKPAAFMKLVSLARLMTADDEGCKNALVVKLLSDLRKDAMALLTDLDFESLVHRLMRNLTASTSAAFATAALPARAPVMARDDPNDMDVSAPVTDGIAAVKRLRLLTQQMRDLKVCFRCGRPSSDRPPKSECARHFTGPPKDFWEQHYVDG